MSPSDTGCGLRQLALWANAGMATHGVATTANAISDDFAERIFMGNLCAHADNAGATQ